MVLSSSEGEEIHSGILSESWPIIQGFEDMSFPLLLDHVADLLTVY